MLQLKKVTIETENVCLIKELNLCVNEGEIVTLMGPSGSGKSTLLSWMIGDLDSHFSGCGELWLMNERRDALTTEKRRIGILFQDDLLFPHMSVGQNLVFAMPEGDRGIKVRREKGEEVLDKIGLAGFYDRDPWTLSGGQRARVSVMRTLLSEPEALLLDEPFSRLDQALRQQFREFVYYQVNQRQIPTLLVTHDFSDVPVDGQVIELASDKRGGASDAG